MQPPVGTTTSVFILRDRPSRDLERPRATTCLFSLQSTKMLQSKKQMHALLPFLLPGSRSLQELTKHGSKRAIMLGVLCASNPRVWEMEAGKLGFKSQPWLQTEFKANLGCLRSLYEVSQPRTQSLCAPTPGHASYHYVLLSTSVTTVVIRCCWCITLPGKKKKKT